ncbi:hypothetical protein [Acidianus sp. HS-5]|uniref:hypothetical protein n=1 Tax=Acidianus sp. HS-5 TaxID=2886040 RepID=UPI001F328908|nr:hypothetical protein [Acidianus sp. HS-5]BDC19185.1 hypothetical protein HS5_20750 [Acidianus sp. HS-5]
MSDSNFSIYPRVIVEFESDLDKVKTTTSDDAKKLIDLAYSLSLEMDKETKKIFDEISSDISKETQDEIDRLRKNYADEREKKIKEIKDRANKNLEKAISEVLNAIKGAYK